MAETTVGRYVANVEYRYRISDVEFTRSRIRASDGEYGIRDGAVQAIGNLSVGKQLPVSYNPADPRKSVLQADTGFQEYALLVVPLVILGIGLYSARSLWRIRRSNY